jgi:hypothetical protein
MTNELKTKVYTDILKKNQRLGMLDISKAVQEIIASDSLTEEDVKQAEIAEKQARLDEAQVLVAQLSNEINSLTLKTK